MDENSRVSRALKNPLVVGGLCIAAGFAVYNNVVEPTTDLEPVVSVRSTTPSPGQTQNSSELSSQAHDKEATRWIQNPPRDPFAPMVVITENKTLSHQSGGSSPSMQKKRQAPLQRFALKAIAFETQQRSAVINRSVVYEGEMIEGYQVVSIERQGVWLKRQGRKHLLTFETPTTS